MAGISEGDKARLFDVDLAMYAGCGSPALSPERITGCKPRRPTESWPGLFHRSILYRDECHAAKMIRALYSVWQFERGAGTGVPDRKGGFLKGRSHGYVFHRMVGGTRREQRAR